MRGKFITFEGLDGSGKSTQLKRLKEWLPESGLVSKNSQVIRTREPGFIPTVRDILKSTRESLHPEAELLLLLADRVQHVSKYIEPLLSEGYWVLCDRYISSTLAYQGYARGIGVERVRDLLSSFSFPDPDLELFFDIPVDESIHRTRSRSQSYDRFEAEGKFFLERVYDGYERTAPSYRVSVDGCQREEQIAEECQKILKNFNALQQGG